eukprot:13023097-Alexandrium_andersonii.AAC.1
MPTGCRTQLDTTNTGHNVLWPALSHAYRFRTRTLRGHWKTVGDGGRRWETVGDGGRWWET